VVNNVHERSSPHCLLSVLSYLVRSDRMIPQKPKHLTPIHNIVNSPCEKFQLKAN
jgi:hypothetical protein